MLVVLAFGFGTQEILLVLALAILLFGATKLPQLGSAIGQGIKNFKRGMREVKAEEDEANKAIEVGKTESDKQSTDEPDKKAD